MVQWSTNRLISFIVGRAQHPSEKNVIFPETSEKKVEFLALFFRNVELRKANLLFYHLI